MSGLDGKKGRFSNNGAWPEDKKKWYQNAIKKH
jgi:hypothetical protein